MNCGIAWSSKGIRFLRMGSMPQKTSKSFEMLFTP